MLMKNGAIFCDFDGTITIRDTVDEFLKRFATEEWLEIEAVWEAGGIGSLECLHRQLDCVRSLSLNAMDDFLASVTIDSHVKAFFAEAKKNHFDLTIVSDGFDYFIQAILAKNDIHDVTYFTNKLSFSEGKLLQKFPYASHLCQRKSGVCKCSILEKYAGKKQTIYIGDGISDYCAARKANLIFAKSKLAGMLAKENIPFIPFTDFREISARLFA